MCKRRIAGIVLGTFGSLLAAVLFMQLYAIMHQAREDTLPVQEGQEESETAAENGWIENSEDAAPAVCETVRAMDFTAEQPHMELTEEEDLAYKKAFLSLLKNELPIEGGEGWCEDGDRYRDLWWSGVPYEELLKERDNTDFGQGCCYYYDDIDGDGKPEFGVCQGAVYFFDYELGEEACSVSYGGQRTYFEGLLGVGKIWEHDTQHAWVERFRYVVLNGEGEWEEVLQLELYYDEEEETVYTKYFLINGVDVGEENWKELTTPFFEAAECEIPKKTLAEVFGELLETEKCEAVAPEQKDPSNTATDAVERVDENITLFDDFSEMDYVLFLETNTGWGLTLDYYKYGIYGDFTKTAEEGEALYFRLNEKILKGKRSLPDDMSFPMTLREWADYTGEHVVYMTPDMEWVISRQYTDPATDPEAYSERWYHDQALINEISNDIAGNTLTFLPYKNVSDGYEAMSAACVQEVNELLNDIYKGFGIRDEKRVCFDETGKLLATGECKQEDVSIYDVYAEKCIRIYDISKEKAELLYEFSVPESEIAWPVEISQLVGDRDGGFLVFSVGDSTYKMNYPAGEVCKIGEFMFDTSYSPDGKYVAYCTGNFNLFYSWEDMYVEEEPDMSYLDLYDGMRERWDAVAPGWYVEELETGRKTYIPIEIWTADLERPLYGGKCMWIEKERLLDRVQEMDFQEEQCR